MSPMALAFKYTSLSPGRSLVSIPRVRRRGWHMPSTFNRALVTVTDDLRRVRGNLTDAEHGTLGDNVALS